MFILVRSTNWLRTYYCTYKQASHQRAARRKGQATLGRSKCPATRQIGLRWSPVPCGAIDKVDCTALRLL